MSERWATVPEKIMGDFSTAVLAKARRYGAHPELVVQDPQFPSVWWVSSLRDPSRKYRVEVGEYEETGPWSTCTCTHGLNQIGGSRCYHVAAVLDRTTPTKELS